MKFLLSREFFLNAVIGLILLYGIYVPDLILNPGQRGEIIFEMMIAGAGAFAFFAGPWWLVAHSTLKEGRKTLCDLRGAIGFHLDRRHNLIEHLVEEIERSSPEHTSELAGLDKQIHKARRISMRAYPVRQKIEQNITETLKKLKEQTPDTRDINACFQKIEEETRKTAKAAALFNQQIDILDEKLGEFPNSYFVEKIFGYKKPAYFSLNLVLNDR